MSAAHRHRRSILSLTLAITVAASLLFTSTHNSSLRRNNIKHNFNRQLSSTNILAQFWDPKSVSPRAYKPIHVGDDSSNNNSDASTPRQRRRENCQIIYVLGVEGSIHHGFMPVIKSLAEQQVDPITGTPYHVVKGHDDLRTIIFGSADLRENSPPLNDPQLVQAAVDAMCPNANEGWKNHIIIEGNSFPSGGTDNVNLQFRVRRQVDWQNMTPEEIATHELALNHPTNLYDFYEAFSQYVDVRFIVLHRPYLETIASHIGFDGGPENHSNVISGFLLLFRGFLMGHLYYNYDAAAAPNDDDNPGGISSSSGNDAGAGAGAGVPLWTIVCADKLSSKQYESQEQLFAAREHVPDVLMHGGWIWMDIGRGRRRRGGRWEKEDGGRGWM